MASKLSNVLRRPSLIDMYRRRMLGHNAHKSVSLTTKSTVPRSFKREDAQSIFVFIDMPGIPRKEVDLTVSSYVWFSVKGQVMKDYECECRKYHSVFFLPKNVDTSGIKANMKDGVLKVTLPKTKEIKQEVEKTIHDFKVMVN